MPLLIALNAHIVLMSARGHRDMPLEAFYTGYRKTVLAPDEVLANPDGSARLVWSRSEEQRE